MADAEHEAAVITPALGLEAATLIVGAAGSLGRLPVSRDAAIECVAAALAGAGDAAPAIADALVQLFADEGGVHPTVLACGAGLLCGAVPAEKLRLVFNTCDADADGIISVDELAFIVKAYNYIVLALVQLMLDGAVDAMAGTRDDKAALLGEVMPVLNAGIARMSRDARELCSSFGITVADFSSWCTSNFCMSAWINRLCAVWSPKLLALGDGPPALLGGALAALPAEDAGSVQSVEALVAQVPAARAGPLRDRLLVLSEQHVAKKPCIATALLLLSGLETTAEFLTAVLDACVGEGAGEIPAAVAECMAESVRSIGEEVADVLLACTSLVLTGKARGGAIPRDAVVRRLAPRISQLVSSVATHRSEAEAGSPLPVAAFRETWLQNEALQQWATTLQQFWPAVVQLYSQNFNGVLLNRQRQPAQMSPGSSPRATEEEEAAQKIQAAARRTTSRNKYKVSLSAAMRVQTVWRMHKSKSVVTVLRLQRDTRTDWEAERKRRMQRLKKNEQQLLALKQVPAANVESWATTQRHDSISSIQASWRGRKVRQEMPAARAEHMRSLAAVQIQDTVRAWLIRGRTVEPDAVSQSRQALKPRAVNQMTAETRQRLQQLIAAKRKTRVRPDSIVDLRTRVQTELEANALVYSARCQAAARRQVRLSISLRTLFARYPITSRRRLFNRCTVAATGTR